MEMQKTQTPIHPVRCIVQMKNDGVKPFAVPVLTPEEARKENNKAKKLQRERAIKKSFATYARKALFLLFLLPLLLFLDVFSKKIKNIIGKTGYYLSVKRRLCILSSVFFFTFGLFVFVPWSIYFGNVSQFPFIFSDFLTTNLLLLTISTVGVSIILLAIPPAVGDYLVSVIVGLGLCVYIQSMFMNCYLQEMNGEIPEWDQHRLWGFVNIALWCIIILVPVTVKKIIPRSRGLIIVSATALAILLLEISAVLSLIASAPGNAWKREKVFLLDASKQFHLSPQKNIIVFVFDAFGSGYLNYCFESDPETKKVFKDFTWFKDARSNYYQTFPGLLHELTGSYVHPSSSQKDLFDKMWHSPSAKSFYEQIKKAGFDARLYIDHDDLGSPKLYQEYFSNIVVGDISYKANIRNLQRGILQVALFSATPFVFKKNFIYDNDSFSDTIRKASSSQTDLLPAKKNDLYLTRMVSSGITADAESPVLAFHYTVGPHPLWLYNEKCVRQKTPYDDPLPTIKGCIYLFSTLLRLLKENNLYDNTAIVFCSDHGSLGHLFKTPFDMSFMIKPFKQRNSSITINQAKIQSIDILPSLLELACGNDAEYGDFEGFPASRIPEDRVRKVYNPFTHPELPPFYEDDATKTEFKFNSLKESIYPETASASKQNLFQRYIPLSSRVDVDEQVLTTQHK